jgi:hypothetical protein
MAAAFVKNAWRLDPSKEKRAPHPAANKRFGLQKMKMAAISD